MKDLDSLLVLLGFFGFSPTFASWFLDTLMERDMQP